MLFDRDKTIIFRHDQRDWLAKFLVKEGRGVVRIVGIDELSLIRQQAARRWFIENQRLFDLEGFE
jgi:hypothetical protein